MENFDQDKISKSPTSCHLFKKYLLFTNHNYIMPGTIERKQDNEEF